MLDLLLGEVGGRVVGPGRAELAAAMGSPSVVVALVLGQDRLQMPLAAGYTAAVWSAASVQSVFAPGVPAKGTRSAGPATVRVSDRRRDGGIDPVATGRRRGARRS